uniref:RmlD-like substrate binding domain-containing protein n=1 Tax=Phaeomonas parva TaxID=124430 RepID=A0A7S1U0Z1_9STRA|mmetsp:Transcript_26669/g.83431  ORF Transcript_26669/g.83431 Transcript_26669/m.83431 type:complete len:238 (+) Transcript_26669:93-806(+)
MQAPRAPVILVIGGGGYLGQFLLEALLPDARDGQWQLHFTQRNSELAVPGATAHAMNLCDEGQIAALLEALRPAVIINTAAMTSLADCEKNPDEASAVNAPEHLFAAAAAAAPAPPLLVQLSTDQVYDGAHAPYAEGDTAAPVNHYGATKLHCEQRMAAAGVNGVVLRSSNILGPPAPFSGAGKFLQWLDGALAAAAQGGDNVSLSRSRSPSRSPSLSPSLSPSPSLSLSLRLSLSC